jgi:hypothetical protein
MIDRINFFTLCIIIWQLADILQTAVHDPKALVGKILMYCFLIYPKLLTFFFVLCLGVKKEVPE